jgi:hypothetical protein
LVNIGPNFPQDTGSAPLLYAYINVPSGLNILLIQEKETKRKTEEEARPQDTDQVGQEEDLLVSEENQGSPLSVLDCPVGALDVMDRGLQSDTVRYCNVQYNTVH